MVVALDNLGDAVMASAVLSPLKKMFPQAQLGLWVKEYVAGLFEGHSLLEVVHAADPFWDKSPGKAKGNMGTFIRTWNDIRKVHYDATLVLNAEWRRSLFCCLAGIPDRVGYARRKSGLFLNHAFPASPRAQHFVDEHRELLNHWAGSSISKEDCLPHLEVTPDGLQWWERWSQEKRLKSGAFTVLYFFSGDENKNWPISCWVELIEGLIQSQPQERFVVLCGPGEESKMASMREKIFRKEVDFLVAPSLSQLKALLRQARLVVGGDSGPGHVAAALGTSVLSLFGPTDPQRSRPLGRGKLKTLQKIPLQQLPVAEVMAATASFFTTS